jgi:hypothetical protein
MSKIIKIVLILIFVIIFVLGFLFYINFGNKIIINKDIKNDIEFTKLNQKQVMFNNVSEKANTNFAYEELNNEDSMYVFYQCFAQKNLYFIPNSITVRFFSNNGFSGSVLDVIKIGSLFGVKLDNYSDNVHNTEKSHRKIIKQTLILDKATYAINDSIFGRIEVTIQEKADDKKCTYKMSGFFRTILQ